MVDENTAPNPGTPGGTPGETPDGAPLSPMHRDPPPPPPAPEVNWRDGLSEELRVAPALKDFKDMNGLAQSFVDTQKMLSRALVFPSDDATPEAWRDVFAKAISLSKGKLINMPDPTDEGAMEVFNKAMGVPQGEDSYTIPEGVPSEYVDKIMEALPGYKELGLNQSQVNALISKSLESAQNQQADMEARALENKAELKKEFGMNFDEVFTATEHYMTNTEVPEQARELFREGQMAPGLAKWFMNQARKAGTEGSNLTRDNNPLNYESVDELKIRAGDLRDKITGMQPGDPSRQAFVNRLLEVETKINDQQSSAA